jgi:methyl halide transferase
MVDWNEKYLTQHTPWDRGEPSPALRHWLESEKPCHIAVPGCGQGHEVVELARHGFEVTAIDLAPRALEILAQTLRRENLKAELIEASVLDWLPEKPLDAVYEQTCFCALDPEHWAQYGRQLAQWIRPKGALVAAFMQTGQDGGPPFHCPISTMRLHLPEESWEWPCDPPRRIDHPRGDIFEAMVVLQRKNVALEEKPE